MGENIKRIILKDLDIINRTSKIAIKEVVDCDIAVLVSYSVHYIPFSYCVMLSEYAKVDNVLESLIISMWQKYLDYIRREEHVKEINTENH